MIRKGALILVVLAWLRPVVGQTPPASKSSSVDWIALPSGTSAVQNGPDGYILIDWKSKSLAAIKRSDFDTNSKVSRFRAGKLDVLAIKGVAVAHASGQMMSPDYENKWDYCSFGQHHCCNSNRYIGQCAALPTGWYSCGQHEEAQCNRR